jgi:hypothetical protein
MTDSPDERLRLDVHGARTAQAAEAATRAVAEDLGFVPADADRAAGLVAHICDVVCRTDFDDPDDARFELTITASPGAMALRVSDRGLPFSLRGPLASSIATDLLGSDTVDRVEVSSGGDGNTVTAEIRRDTTELEHLVDHETTTDEIIDPEPPRIERLRRDHLASLARCTWRVYGHTYVASFLYHPDETWKMVESGRLHSVVALDADDEVIGHVAIELEHPGDRVGDSTLALTDPRYRGHHVLGAVGAELVAIIDEIGLVGTLAEAVTPHTITQRAQVEEGAIETGILLGFIPATMTYRGFSPTVQGTSRQSAVLSYIPFGRAPGRDVHLPDAYHELMTERYEKLGLDREFATPGEPDGTTALDLAVDGPRSLAGIEVATLGSDAVDLIDHHRRALCAAGTEVVYAELPLDDPGTPAVAAGLRERGFFYAGFIPDLRDTDVLRMQYLDVEVDSSIIQLYTDDARALLAFQLADRS